MLQILLFPGCSSAQKGWFQCNKSKTRPWVVGENGINTTVCSGAWARHIASCCFTRWVPQGNSIIYYNACSETCLGSSVCRCWSLFSYLMYKGGHRACNLRSGSHKELSVTQQQPHLSQWLWYELSNIAYFLLYHFSTLRFIAGDEQIFLRPAYVMFDYSLWLDTHTAKWSEVHDQKRHRRCQSKLGGESREQRWVALKKGKKKKKRWPAFKFGKCCWNVRDKPFNVICG